MTKTKILTKQLQEEELNIVDALTIIDATVENLKFKRNDEKGLNAEIESMVAFGSKVEIDALAEYTHHHRTRRSPTRIDDNPDQTAEISFQEFYRKEMSLVLDSLIVEYADNIKVCVDQIRPLGESLQLPLTKPKHKNIKEVCDLFPPAASSVESESLLAELEIFCNVISSQTDLKLESLQDVANFAFKKKEIFPSVNKAYQLLLTSPVSVAKDERCFSKLRIVKNCLRSTMKDERLNDLLVLGCEKDLTDNITNMGRS